MKSYILHALELLRIDPSLQVVFVRLFKELHYLTSAVMFVRLRLEYLLELNEFLRVQWELVQVSSLWSFGHVALSCV